MNREKVRNDSQVVGQFTTIMVEPPPIVSLYATLNWIDFVGLVAPPSNRKFELQKYKEHKNAKKMLVSYG